MSPEDKARQLRRLDGLDADLKKDIRNLKALGGCLVAGLVALVAWCLLISHGAPLVYSVIILLLMYPLYKRYVDRAKLLDCVNKLRAIVASQGES